MLIGFCPNCNQTADIDKQNFKKEKNFSFLQRNIIISFANLLPSWLVRPIIFLKFSFRQRNNIIFLNCLSGEANVCDVRCEEGFAHINM